MKQTCRTCWNKGKIHTDCPVCKGTGAEKIEIYYPGVKALQEEKIEGDKYQGLLNQFIAQEREKVRTGSGDDGFYEDKIIKYIHEQRGLWIEIIKFTEKKLMQEKVDISFEQQFPEFDIEELRKLEVLNKKRIEKYCLSKQRVKEIINKKIELSNLKASDWMLKKAYQDLLNELNIERRE